MCVSIRRKVQYQGVDMGGGYAPSRAKCEAEDKLWVENDPFSVNNGRTLYMTLYTTNK